MKAKLPKQDQIDFITNKVTELGSVEAVQLIDERDGFSTGRGEYRSGVFYNCSDVFYRGRRTV